MSGNRLKKQQQQFALSPLSYMLVYLYLKNTKLKLPVLVDKLFSYPLTLTSLHHWDKLGNQHSGLPGETISLPVLCAANIRHPGISSLHRHSPLRVPYHTLVERNLGDSFLVPREIHVRTVQDPMCPQVPLLDRRTNMHMSGHLLGISIVIFYSNIVSNNSDVINRIYNSLSFLVPNK